MEKSVPGDYQSPKNKEVESTSSISRYTEINQSCETCVHDGECVFETTTKGSRRVIDNRRYYRRNFVDIMGGCPKWIRANGRTEELL
jgi:hypothetical protein